ncbi:MAG: DUF1194 domain-containing protein [Pseudomonadota bacterium]
MMSRAKRFTPGAAIAVLVALLSVGAPQTAEARCRLALVLALDVSASVDAREYGLLARGTAGAIRSPEVRAALKALGGVHMTAFEWSGRFQQHRIAPWIMVEEDIAIDTLAGHIATHPRTTSEYPTALGAALGYAATLLRDAPADCQRRVVDVAGDGENNHGFAPRHAYSAFNFNGVTVNGLVVASDEAGKGQAAIGYYREEVLKGPDAFLEIAASYDDFQEAMKRKLLREIGVISLVERRNRADPSMAR